MELLVDKFSTSIGGDTVDWPRFLSFFGSASAGVNITPSTVLSKTFESATGYSVEPTPSALSRLQTLNDVIFRRAIQSGRIEVGLGVGRERQRVRAAASIKEVVS
jgi:hypothetical protein